MKKHFRKGAFRWASLILTVVMAINLLPLTAMAEGTDPWDWSSGSGTAEDPFVGLVSSQEDLNAAQAKINNNDDDNNGKYYTVSLQADIACTNSFNVSRNNVTLLGNGHTLKFKTPQGDVMAVEGINDSSPQLSLGKQNGADDQNTLTITRSEGAAIHGNGTPCITVGNVGNGGVHKGTLIMNKFVTITGLVGTHTYGGAIAVGRGGSFEMNGGSITKCGIRGGSICHGGGIAVVGGGVFTMNGGTISECYAESSSTNWQVPYASGGGVFVGNGSTFVMNDGTIQDNYAAQNGGGVCVIASTASYFNHNSFGYVDSKFAMNGGTICRNTAKYMGGGLAVLGTYINASGMAAPTPGSGTPADPGVYISEGSFLENEAAYGGGIFFNWIQPSIPAEIHNAVISENKAIEGAGIDILSKWTQADIDRCTISKNKASENGGGIALTDNVNSNGTTLKNSNISQNTAHELGGGLYLTESSLTFDSSGSACVIYDNTATIGADDLYKDSSSAVNALPTADQMTAASGSAVKLAGWYWDHEERAGETYEYNGMPHPCARYSADNAVAYTPVDSETAERYLKVVRVTDFKVQFDENCTDTVHDMPATQSVAPGQTAVEPVAPARDDYEFAGWYKDALCTQRYDFSSPVTANITLYAKWVQGLPHYILQYGDGRPGDGGDQYTFPYDPASPEKLPTEVKYFSQEEIEQLPEQSIYEGVTMEGTYFLAWYGYMPALVNAINPKFPVLEKTGENTYTEFSGTPAAGTTYFQFIPCETTPDTNLGDIIYYAQWVKVKVDIEVDIKVDVDVSFSENLGGKVVMIDDSQKLVLAKNFRPSDIVSNNCEITLTATVANPKIPAEEAKTAEYMAQNYPNCRSISYDVEITKDIVSGGSPYSSETLKKLAAPIEIRFAVPNEWRNGTVKMLRAHTDPGTGTVTVSECQNLSSDKSWFILSSDEFSTYTLLYIPSGGGTGGSGGGTSAYTLRYQSNGGTPCPDEKKTSAWSKDYDSLPVPVREGYLFTGWFADSGLQTPISEDVQVNRRLVTIYAGWEKSMVPAMLNGDDHYAYVQGYSDGTVRPNDNITRAEVATIFFRLLKDEIREENLSDVNTFEDVTDGMWCNKAISTMAVLGVVKGRTAEYFDPDAPITRGEFAAICSRFDKSDIVARENFTDIEGYWAKEEIERAAILGWVRGYTDGSFRPRNYITRAEAMTMINRVLHRVPESPEDLLPDMVTWPDNKLTDWYYLAVQEATNSHIPERKVNGYESWFALTYNRDWSIYQS